MDERPTSEDEKRELQASIKRLTRDQVLAARDLGDKEVRYVVDSYYMMQDQRKRADNQVRAMLKEDVEEPHELVSWIGTSADILENQIKRALQSYAESKVVGRWLLSLHGIGPVISAGMLAHIDIHKAPTAGHIWRFAGLDPTKKWLKKQKRPWNPELKTLCWKTGQCFMKFSGDERCTYGNITYRERKAYEQNRNDSGGNAERARADFEANRYDKSTDAYKAVASGKLPQAQVDAQARRYTVKLFLSHVHCALHWHTLHKLPPDPYAIAHLEHVHFVPLPNPDLIPGLAEALAKKGWL